MDLTAIAQSLYSHLNVVNVALFIMLVLSEVLGSVPKIKASSIYDVMVALLTTVKQQVWPQ